MIIWYLFTRFDKNSKHDSQNWRTLEFLNDAKNNRSPDRMWIISWILAKSNQKGHCSNKNYGKLSWLLKTIKTLKILLFQKSRGLFLYWHVFFVFYYHIISQISLFYQLWKRIPSVFLKNEIFSHKNVSLLLRK